MLPRGFAVSLGLTVLVLTAWLFCGCKGVDSNESRVAATEPPLTLSNEPAREPEPPSVPEPEPEAQDEGPVFLTPKGVRGVPLTLIVSNQSSTTPRIDLTVSIDDQVVLSRDVTMSDMGHSYVSKVVHLAKGAHRIAVHSKGGDARLNESFELSQARWATLDYWYENIVREGKSPTRSFAFRMHDKPVLLH